VSHTVGVDPRLQFLPDLHQHVSGNLRHYQWCEIRRSGRPEAPHFKFFGTHPTRRLGGMLFSTFALHSGSEEWHSMRSPVYTPFSQHMLLKMARRQSHSRLVLEKEFVHINYLFGICGLTMKIMTILLVYHLKIQPKQQSHATAQKWNQKLFPRVMDSSDFHRDTRVTATLTAGLLTSPVAQKLCRCKHGLFVNRRHVHSRTLLRIEIVCCCLCSI
jgi:hypothetical protein